MKQISYLGFGVVFIILSLAVAYFNGFVVWPFGQTIPDDPLEAAIVEFRRAIELEPGNPEGYQYLSQAYQQAGRPEQVIILYEEAVAANPGLAWPYNALGDFYWENNEPDKAIVAYEQGIAAEPENTSSYLKLAITYRLTADYDRAMEWARHATRLASDPDQAGQAYLEQGWIYQAQRKNQQALAQFLQAVNVAPTNPQFLGIVGDFYQWLNQPKDAIPYYRRATTLEPDRADLYARLGQALLAANQPEEALESLELALRLNPDDSETHLVMAGFYRQQAEYEQAITHARQALSSPEKHTLARANYELGLIEQAQNNLNEALDYFTRAVETAPEIAWLQVELGNFYLRQLNRPEEAIRVYNKALTLTPQDVWYHVVLGEAQLAAGREQEARQTFQETISLAPQDVGVYQAIANLVIPRGNWPAVILLYEQALAQGVVDTGVFLALGDVYWHNGNVDQALVNYNKAASLDPDSPEVKERLRRVTSQTD